MTHTPVPLGKYIFNFGNGFPQEGDPLIFPECVSGSFFSARQHYTHFQSSHIKSESKAAAAVKYKFCAKPAWKSFWNKFNYRNLITINPPALRA